MSSTIAANYVIHTNQVLTVYITNIVEVFDSLFISDRLS